MSCYHCKYSVPERLYLSDDGAGYYIPCNKCEKLTPINHTCEFEEKRIKLYDGNRYVEKEVNYRIID